MKILDIFLKKTTVIAVPYIWVILFFLIPFISIILLSFSLTQDSIPPYKFLIKFYDSWLPSINAYYANYKLIFTDKLYILAYITSLKIALYSTCLALFLGFPLAYGIFKSSNSHRSILLILVLIPFFTSSLIRVYCWMTILKTEGLVNDILLRLHIISSPLKLLNTKLAVVLGITYSYLPFMIMPIYAALEKINPNILEASADLGAKPLTIFTKVILPLSFNGVTSGCLMVFIPAIGEFVIPDILGGSSVLTIGKVIWNEFFLNRDWPVASSLAVVITILVVVPMTFIQRIVASNDE